MAFDSCWLEAVQEIIHLKVNLLLYLFNFLAPTNSFSDGWQQDHAAGGEPRPHRPHRQDPLLPGLQQRREEPRHQDQAGGNQADIPAEARIFLFFFKRHLS